MTAIKVAGKYIKIYLFNEVMQA